MRALTHTLTLTLSNYRGWGAPSLSISHTYSEGHTHSRAPPTPRVEDTLSLLTLTRTDGACIHPHIHLLSLYQITEIGVHHSHYLTHKVKGALTRTQLPHPESSTHSPHSFRRRVKGTLIQTHSLSVSQKRRMEEPHSLTHKT